MTNIRQTGTRILLAVALAMSLLMTVAVVSPAPAEAAGFSGYCQCTQYVSNYYNLPNTFPDAMYWNGWLPSQGWYRDSVPQVGDIIVIQPGCYGGDGNCGGNHWIRVDSPGHVAIVGSGTYQISGNQWVVQWQGANQHAGTPYTDHNCTDVSNINPQPITVPDSRIVYWKDYPNNIS